MRHESINIKAIKTILWTSQKDYIVLLELKVTVVLFYVTDTAVESYRVMDVETVTARKSINKQEVYTYHINKPEVHTDPLRGYDIIFINLYTSMV